MLDAILGVKALEPLISNDNLLRLKLFIQKKAGEEEVLSAGLQRILSFDMSWYKRVDHNVDMALTTGAYESFENYFLSRGLECGRPLLAAYAEGLDDLYAGLRKHSDSLRLADVVAATKRPRISASMA